MRLEDIAKRARVSVATVSRVVNNPEMVRISTRKRVTAVLNELNYTPNLQARLLASGQSKVLGVIVSNLENPFFVDLFHTLEESANRAGYELLLANTNYDVNRLSQTMRMMLGRRVAGILVAASEELPPDVAAYISSQVLMVRFSTGEAQAGVTHIRTDEHGGVARIVDHLYSLGHRNIAYLGHRSAYGTTNGRQAAFAAHADALGIEHRALAVVERDSWEQGREGVRQLVTTGFNASAIVCVNDVIAAGVIRELYSRKIDVPRHVSVTGFDNVAVSQFVCPSITTVHISRDEVTARVIETLTAKPARPVTSYTIDPELIVRESTGRFCGSGILGAFGKA